MVLFLFSVYTKSIFNIIAAIMQTEDYEDALQMVCASRIKANFIITRNIQFLFKWKTPEEMRQSFRI